MDTSYAKKILSNYIASNIHENWRAERVVSTKENNIKYNSYWEKTNDIKFIYNIASKKRIEEPYKDKVVISENNVIVDIANLEFIALPYDLQYRAVTFAKDCLELVFDKILSSQLISNTELDELTTSIYIKYAFNNDEIKESSILSSKEIENIKKQEYKAILTLCMETVQNYKKRKIDLSQIETNFNIEKESTTDLNLMDATKFLKIDSKPLIPLLYLKYSATKKEDLYWNTDNYSSIISYLNSNNIKNTWFIKNYSKFIEKIKGENLNELLERLKTSIEKYENKPKWLVKVEKSNAITEFFKKLKQKIWQRKIENDLKRYEEEKILFRFLKDYIDYTSSIDQIKIRYSNYNRNGICLIKIDVDNRKDVLYMYSDGSIVYVPSDFWNNAQLLCNINIGKDVTENMVKFLSNESCYAIANVVMSCSMRLKDKPVFSKTINLKKLLSLSSNFEYVENV